MKAWIFVGLWLGTGALLAMRGARSPTERALCLLFWPFFLAGGDTGTPAPLTRLRVALGPEGTGADLVATLEGALGDSQARLARVEQAIAQLPEPGSGPVAEARRNSRRLLEEARDRQRLELDQALASIEEAATRLYLARESSERSEVQRVLESLRNRLLAEEEVAVS